MDMHSFGVLCCVIAGFLLAVGGLILAWLGYGGKVGEFTLRWRTGEVSIKSGHIGLAFAVIGAALLIVPLFVPVAGQTGREALVEGLMNVLPMMAHPGDH